MTKGAIPRSKHLDALQASKMTPGEVVVAWFSAQRADGALFGIAFVTDRRVGYFRRGIFGEKFETVGIDKVSSVEVSGTLGFRTVKIFTSGDSLILKTSAQKAEVQAFVAAVEERKIGSVHKLTTDDPIDQLTRLGHLHAAGVLTAEEFATKKAELLSRL